MNRLRVAVIGVGALGRHHARILSELESVELVAVADSQPQRGQEVAAKHQTRWVADYRELLDRKLVERLQEPFWSKGFRFSSKSRWLEA